MKKTVNFVFLEIAWPRPFGESAVWNVLTQLATASRSGPIVFEIRAARGKIRYLMGVPACDIPHLKSAFTAVLPDIRFKTAEKESSRTAVSVAASVKRSGGAALSLNIHNTEAIVRALLAAMAHTRHKDHEAVLQIVLGSAFTPSLLPDKLPDSTASWLDALRGTIGPASSDTKRLMREKAECHGFYGAIRIGAVADNIQSAHGKIREIYSALKTIETAGAKLKIVPDRSENLNAAKRPYFYPLRLSIKELPAFLGWPLGETEFTGVAGLHPRILLPPKDYHGDKRSFGAAALTHTPLSISARDSLYHTQFLGPTGSGKSTAMLNVILADIHAGNSVFVIDPKSDLVTNILENVPESRTDDVVIIDPSAPIPAGFNPLNGSGKNSTLTADAILAVLQDLFADSWGIRTQDILSAALMTLAKTSGATLIWLPALLTDDHFRRKILENISDPMGLDAFWAGFEAMSKAERNQVISPVLNKIRQFLLRPELRAVLGQSDPKFHMEDLFHKRRIVLVQLNRGLIGHESAKLMGSLLIGQLWTLALGRAAISPEKRHIVNVYIDEVQDYLRLPGDLSDALSQARGLGVGLNLAHQYRSQLPANLRSAIDANVHNKIVFGLNAADARDMAAMSPQLESTDFMLLPRFHVYAHLMHNGQSAGWMFGQTAPPPKPIRTAAELKAKSMEIYGQDAKEVEQEYLTAIGFTDEHKNINPDEPIGRRRRNEK